MSASEYERLRVQTQGEYAGIGIQIARRNGWVTVIAPLPGPPDRVVQLMNPLAMAGPADQNHFRDLPAVDQSRSCRRNGLSGLENGPQKLILA